MWMLLQELYHVCVRLLCFRTRSRRYKLDVARSADGSLYTLRDSYGNSVHVPTTRWHEPQTIEELARIVSETGAAGTLSPTTIVVVGSGHTSIPLYTNTSAEYVSLKHFNRLDIDCDTLTCRAGSAWTMGEIAERLRDVALDLPVSLEFGVFSVGAVSGTHAHDSCCVRGRSSAFSSHVTSYTVVLSDGRIHTVREEDELHFWRSHFGCMGIVVDVTFSVVPLQTKRNIFRVVPATQYLETLESLNVFQAGVDMRHQPYGITAMYMPFNDTVFLDCMYMLPRDAPRPWFDRLQGYLLRYWGFMLTYVFPTSAAFGRARWVQTAISWYVAVCMYVLTHVTFTSSHFKAKLPGPEFRVPPGLYHDMAIDRERYQDAFAASRAQAQRCYRESGRYSVSGIFSYTIPKDTASILSRSKYSDVMTVDFTQFGCPSYEACDMPAYLTEFINTMLRQGARPHFNKTALSRADLSLSGFRLADLRNYVAFVRRLDPTGRFRNAFFEKIDTYVQKARD